MRDLSGVDIFRNMEGYLNGGGRDDSDPTEGREASFDYCFNYFQSFRETGRVQCICSQDDSERSCLQLAFFLASWGMLRGSSWLSKKSAKYYQRVLESVVQLDPRVWAIDLPYTGEDIDMLLEVGGRLREATEGRATDTLVTKVMLGVFGNVPALDSYFRAGLGVSCFDRACLERVTDFYEQHKAIIDTLPPVLTLDFHSGKSTSRRYTKAKIVDMVGWMEGYNILDAG
jgi:hypothetical protein